MNGRAGRAKELVSKLQANDLPGAAGGFYNSLEAPAFEKFPVLALYQEFLRENGALVSLMSGSGSTTFAIAENLAAAENLAEKFKSRVWRQRLDGGGAGLGARGDLRNLLNSADPAISFAAGILNASARIP